MVTEASKPSDHVNVLKSFVAQQQQREHSEQEQQWVEGMREFGNALLALINSEGEAIAMKINNFGLELLRQSLIRSFS